jgi:hypothetical protein
MNFDKMLIRCSSLGLVCGDGRSICLTDKMQQELKELQAKDKLTDKQAQKVEELVERSKCKNEFSLSQTAMSYVQELVDQKVFKYKTTLENKEMDKGILCEDDAIALDNAINFTNYKKNKVEMFNEYISGTCDVLTPKDINFVNEHKVSWSKKTFPKTKKDAYSFLYEIQQHGYMELFDRDNAKLIYSLINTPDHLIPSYEDISLHVMDDVPLHLRQKTLTIERSSFMWDKIKGKVLECRRYANWYYEGIINDTI